ncbi:MAG: metallophosphoesterase [Treponema sp.]|nr:metallophosphoesterase [Treponema sp.]
MRERLLVFSDSHGYAPALKLALAWARESGRSPDAVAFLGDGLDDAESAEMADRRAGFSCPWHKARGNNDFGFATRDSALFELGGSRFFACHGHRHSLYSGLETLAAAARASGANVALFGHTHAPFAKTVDGILLLNPGSIGSPRSSAGATFALIECEPGEPPSPSFWGMGRRGAISPVPAGKM